MAPQPIAYPAVSLREGYLSASSFELLTRHLNLLDVRFSPNADAFDQTAQGASEASQRVLDLGGNAGIDAPAHDAVALESAQRVGQDFLRNPVHRTPKLRESERTVREAPNNQDRPLIRNEIKDLASGTVAVEDVPRWSGFQ